MAVVPVAKAPTLCDRAVGQPQGKVDLAGIFNAIRPQPAYPYVHEWFCVFAQLGSGLGRVEFHIDVRSAATDERVWTSVARPLFFPDRAAVLQVSLVIERCSFPSAGVYVVELYCDNTWVCDTRLVVRDAGDRP